MSRRERLAMVEREEPRLSIVRQCRLLELSRSSVYYRPVPVCVEELRLMVLIDRQYLKTPFYGSRRMAAWLRREGHPVSRKRVQRLMQLLGLQAIYQKPNTSRPAPESRIFPYLLRGLVIDRPNQVWCADITYIPMAKGFVYLVAIMDWASRKVLAWRLSNTLEAEFCVEALEEALARYGSPGIFNTDQGSQFTSAAFTGVLQDHGVRISMDGKGRFMDNIFVERLWRSLKYEEVYLKAYDSVAEARAGISCWLRFYNTERPHQALADQTPDEVFHNPGPTVDLMDNAEALPTTPQPQQQQHPSFLIDSMKGKRVLASTVVPHTGPVEDGSKVSGSLT